RRTWHARLHRTGATRGRRGDTAERRLVGGSAPLGNPFRPAPVLGRADPGGRPVDPGGRASARRRATRAPATPDRRRRPGAGARALTAAERIRLRHGAPQLAAQAREREARRADPGRGEATLTGPSPCSARGAGRTRGRDGGARGNAPPLLAAAAGR